MKSVSRTAGSALRRVARPIRTQAPRNCLTPSAVALPRSNAAPVAATRAFHLSTSFRGILPDVENPKPKESEPSERPTVPTDITTEEFHERADEFIDDLVTRLEAQQETRSDLEIEHSAGVLDVSLANVGTYVINKQPNNKQIWLSSPISGPKRFDWVVLGEGLDQKEGSGAGDWVYLRDNTSLAQLLRKELGVDAGMDEDAPQ